MSTAKSLLIRTLLILTVIATAVFSQAQPVPVGALTNFDVRNDTGQIANDFELTLFGISPANIATLYRGDYPNTTVTQSGSTTTIRWTGRTTNPGTYSHFGVSFVGINTAILPRGARFSWSKDGVLIGTLPITWQFWDPRIGATTDVLTNQGGGVVFVRRRVVISTQETMDLAELMVGRELWNRATIVDTAPVPIRPGERLLYDYALPTPRAWAVMIYEVYTSPGEKEPVMRFLNASNNPPQTSGKAPAKPTKASKPAAKSKTTKDSKPIAKKANPKTVKA